MYRLLTTFNNHIIFGEKNILNILKKKENILIQSIKLKDELKYLKYPFIATSKDLFYLFNKKNEYFLIKLSNLKYGPILIKNIFSNPFEYILLDKWGDFYQFNIKELSFIDSFQLEYKIPLNKIFGNLSTNLSFLIKNDVISNKIILKIIDKFRRIIYFDLKNKKILNYKNNSNFLNLFSISNNLQKHILLFIENIKYIIRLEFFNKNIYILTFDNLYIFNQNIIISPKIFKNVIDFTEEFYLKNTGQIINIFNEKEIKQIKIFKDSIFNELKRSINFF